jgi:uncharacterized protein
MSLVPTTTYTATPSAGVSASGYASGMWASGGQALGGLGHLVQSVKDILTTPIGSRVLRRDYGSNLHELVDQNITGRLRLAVVLYTAQALEKWEPRFIVQAVRVTRSGDAGVLIDLDGLYKPMGLPVTLSNVAVRVQ